MPLVALEEHDLGECERTEGFTCEECRIWYMEQSMEWGEADAWDRLDRGR